MAENENICNILSHKSIEERTKSRWDSKSCMERVRTSTKYRHIFAKYHLPSNDWSNVFNELSSHQRNILLKGELIRTYDSLANKDKTRIKKEFGLSHFSSKWFKLPSRDKKILLKSVLSNG